MNYNNHFQLQIAIIIIAVQEEEDKEEGEEGRKQHLADIIDVRQEGECGGGNFDWD